MRHIFALIIICSGHSYSYGQQSEDDLLLMIPTLMANISPPNSSCSFSHPNAPTDDPNSVQTNGYGRAAVSANPVPEGYPTPLTTGICGVGLSEENLTASGSIEVSIDGTVIDGMDITGTLTIEANNVLIRNSRITATGLYALNVRSGYSNIVIEDTRIRGVGDAVSSAVQGYSPYTLRRVHVTGGSDNIKAHAGILVEDSYVTGVYKSPGSHNDVVQIRGGSGYIFRNSSFLGPWQQSTSAFIIQAKSNDVDDLVIEDSYISGGGYSIYTNENNGYSMTNVFVTNNRFELDSWQYGWRSANAGVYSGNVLLPSP